MMPTKRDTQADIDEFHKLITRAAPLWRDESAFSTVLRVTANGDFRELLDNAKNGCKHAHRALCEQAALHLRDRETLPDDINDYAIGVMRREYPKEGSAGEDGARDIARNLVIGYLVELARLRGYDVRRAIYIVKQAATGTGMKRPLERRVRDIWKEYGEGLGALSLNAILAALEAEKTVTRPPRV